MKNAACLLGQMDILEKGSGKLGLYQKLPKPCKWQNALCHLHAAELRTNLTKSPRRRPRQHPCGPPLFSRWGNTTPPLGDEAHLVGGQRPSRWGELITPRASAASAHICRTATPTQRSPGVCVLRNSWSHTTSRKNRRKDRLALGTRPPSRQTCNHAILCHIPFCGRPQAPQQRRQTLPPKCIRLSTTSSSINFSFISASVAQPERATDLPSTALHRRLHSRLRPLLFVHCRQSSSLHKSHTILLCKLYQMPRQTSTAEKPLWKMIK